LNHINITLGKIYWTHGTTTRKIGQQKQTCMKSSKISISAICIGTNINEISLTLDSLIEVREELLEVVVIDSSEAQFTKGGHCLANKICLTRQYPPMGISNAFNKGIEVAKGDYVVFYNAGDQCIPQGFRSELEQLVQNPSLEIVTGPIILNYHKKRQIWRPRYRNSKIAQIHHIGTIYRRNLHKKCGKYDPFMKCAMDYSFLRRALRECQPNQIIVIEEPVSIFEMGGISTQLNSQRQLEVLASDIQVDSEIIKPIARYVLSKLKSLAREACRKQFRK
jgi:hypothetical protein